MLTCEVLETTRLRGKHAKCGTLANLQKLGEKLEDLVQKEGAPLACPRARARRCTQKWLRP